MVGRLVVVFGIVVVMIVYVCVNVVVVVLLFIVMLLSDCKVWRRDRGLGGRRGGGGAGQGEWTTCAKQSGLGFLYFVTADILKTQDLGFPTIGDKPPQVWRSRTKRNVALP